MSLYSLNSYFIIVALTFGALVLMAGISFQALSLQREDEVSREKLLARTRVESAARIFFEGLGRRLPELTALRAIAGSPESTIHPLPVPVGPEATEILLRAADSADKRHFFLEGFINASQEEKLFWAFLLFRESLAESDLSRLLRLTGDARLPDGFTVKTRGVLDFAAAVSMKGRNDEAAAWLLRAGTLSFPIPLPQGSADFWPPGGSGAGGDGHLAKLAALVHWTWAAAGDSGIKEGWHLHDGIPILAVFSVGGPFFALGDKVFDEYFWILEKAAGEGFVLEIRKDSGPAGSSVSGSTTDFNGSHLFPLPYAAGMRYELSTVGGAFASRSYVRVFFGVVLSVALVGFSIMVLHGIRKNQEERLTSEREVFFRQAAHDLKTPLTTMRVLAETLVMGRARSEERRNHYLASMIGEIDRAAELVDTMLMTARLESRAIKPRFEKISPAGVIERLLRRFQPRLEGWKVEIECSELLQTVADPDMFERVMVNLIENALRHAGAGKELTISAREAGKDTCDHPRRYEGFAVSVGDRGPGLANTPSLAGATLPAGLMDSVSGTVSAGRRGFGLFLIRMILELHGGIIAFEDRSGGGLLVTTFWPHREVT